MFLNAFILKPVIVKTTNKQLIDKTEQKRLFTCPHHINLQFGMQKKSVCLSVQFTFLYKGAKVCALQIYLVLVFKQFIIQTYAYQCDLFGIENIFFLAPNSSKQLFFLSSQQASFKGGHSIFFNIFPNLFWYHKKACIFS